MFPYADDTPSYSVPIWVFVLIGLNLLIGVFTFFGDFGGFIQTIYAYGLIPARFFQSEDQLLELTENGLSVAYLIMDQSTWAAPFVTLFTSIFLHAGFFHLLGNMWFLWLFGDNVEDRMGKVCFPIFYIVSGVLAGLIHIAGNSDSTVPAIGASGAIAGVMGAYIYLFPRATIATFTGYFLYFFTLHIPAPIYLGIWFLFQLAGGFAGEGASNVAFWAHIGGFVAGLLLAFLMSKLGLITRYPGDGGYMGPTPPRAQVSAFTPRRKRRYTWRG